MSTLIQSAGLTGARLGHCRVCADYTVLPAFGDGRCFGCTSDEVDEPEWQPKRQIILSEDPEFARLREILDVFEEAQGSVPAYKLVAAMLGPNGSFNVQRHGLWLPRTHLRTWCIPTPHDLMREGLARNKAFSEYARGLRKARQAKGLCGSCSAPSSPGMKTCPAHTTPRARYLDWKTLGACIGCGGARAPGRKCCPSCLASRSRVRAKLDQRHKSEGRCITCLSPTDGNVRCLTCRNKYNANRRSKRAIERKAPK